MKKNKNGCDLNSCELCRLCLKEWLPALDANRQSYHYKKGELIFVEGEKVNGIFFVNEGKVKVHKKWGPDKELIVRIANKGAIVGHRGLGTNLIYPVSGTALEPVTVCYIDMEFFLSTVKVNYDFAHRLLIFFADELQESEKKMRNLAHMTVKGRLAQTFLTFQDRFGLTEEGNLNIVISRQDLASYAGTTYETVFRIMNEFVLEKIISVRDKNICINDPVKLSAYTTEQI